MKKQKRVTQLSLEYSEKVCSNLPDEVRRLEVRKLIASAYAAGHNNQRRRYYDKVHKIFNIRLIDIDSPIFTHAKEFETHFKYIMDIIKNILIKK
ncbi:MAG: hypothetical protein LBJ63_07695 [Prevotellaceae bacterium]|jgi:hypothetical protein|nr:hypothetical protein [Prevotellaceae bacterium]